MSCWWCESPATGTALERVATPAGWGMELGGRRASCGEHGVGYSATVYHHVVTCLYCGPIAVADGLSDGSRAAVEHTDATGHMTMSRQIEAKP